MTKAFIILFVMVLGREVQAVDPPPPNITYACSKAAQPNEYSLDIYLKGLTGNTTIIVTNDNLENVARVPAENPGAACRANTTVYTTETNVKVTNCNDPRSSSAVYLYLMKTRYIGAHGFRMYKLDCKVPTNGTKSDTKVNFGNAEHVTQTTLAPFLKVPLKMVIDGGSADIKIGQELLVKINDESKVDHHYKLKQCTATASQEKNSEMTVLFSDGPQIQEIFKSPEYEKADTAIQFILYAFRFPSTKDVYLKCTVIICNSDDPTHICSDPTTPTPATQAPTTTTPATTTPAKPAAASGRRKRSSNEEITHIQSVEGHFQIGAAPEKHVPSAGSATESSTFITLLVAMISAMLSAILR